MAENESLDLGQPGGQRWKHVLDAVRKKKSPAEIARQIELKLPKALRKALKEFAECGVPFAEFMKSRDNSQHLRRLVRQCGGHEFANLFQQTAAVAQGNADNQLLSSYIHGMLDRVFDQITHTVAGAEWGSVGEIRVVLRQARELVKPDIVRLADKLANNHEWNPTVKKRSQEEKEQDSAALMNVSLLGGNMR